MLLPSAFLYLGLRRICSNSSYRILSRLRMRGLRQAKSRAAVRFLARFRNPRRGCKTANLTKRWSFTRELLKRRDKGWSIQLRRAHELGREQEKDQIQYVLVGFKNYFKVGFKNYHLGFPTTTSFNKFFIITEKS